MMLRGHVTKTAIVIFAFLLALPTVSSRAQSSSCGEPTLDSSGWPSGTVVTVNIDNTTGMTQDQQDAIEDALAAWAGTGNVTFSISYGAIANSNASYNISIGTLNSAYGQTIQPSSGSPLTTINSAETDYDAVFKTATHEIGHTFGLGEGTYGDSSGDTAMANGSCGGSPPNSPCGTEGPTSNDISATDCHNAYNQNSCGTPGDVQNPNCGCGSSGPNGAGNCDGGLTCTAGTCGCTDACDDPSCTGYDPVGCQINEPCGEGGDCPGGLTCQDDGTCGCSDSCDDPSCPGYSSQNCNDTCNDACDPDCSNYDPSSCNSCQDPCDPACANYDPYMCDPGDPGDPGNGNPGCDPGDNGCSGGGYCDDGDDYEDCDEDAMYSPDVPRITAVSSGISFALILPFMLRRRKPNGD